MANSVAAASTRSDAAPASDHVLAEAPSWRACSVPMPMARSRAPIARAITLTGASLATGPIQVPADVPGSSDQRAPTTTRPAAMVRRSCRWSTGGVWHVVDAEPIEAFRGDRAALVG